VATMSDVARLAGVSVSTVSYAMTGTRPITPATRERIERAMRELGYTPNALARGLKSKRSKIIALLYPPAPGRGLDLSGLEYILGASYHAQESGYHLLLWTTEADALGDLARLAGQGLIDGVLMMEVKLRDGRVKVLTDVGLPFAMIGRTEDATGIDFIDTDFEQCTRAAVGYLTGLGHHRLGFVNQAPAMVEAGVGNVVRARDGAVRAAREAGAGLTVVACESSLAAGRQAFAEMLRLEPGLTAVIALNEQAVPGIMAAAAGHGWRVPEDFSVVSIAMTPQAAEMTTPAMTTVSPSATEMGRAGVDVLIRRLEGADGPVSQQLFPGALEVRGTSGPPRGE
jgi:DNA-binding LacI/PurR family transcriptional regulator